MDFTRKPKRISRKRIPLPSSELLLKKGHVQVRLLKDQPVRIVRGSTFQKTFEPGRIELVPEEVWNRWLVHTNFFELVKNV